MYDMTTSKGRHAYYKSDEWKMRRDKYFHQTGGHDGYVCCINGCGARDRLELNHLTYKHAGEGKERVWELCWMCREHHEMFHHGLIKITVTLPPRTFLWFFQYQPVRVYSEPPVYIYEN